jgi:hypothetical protein
MTTRLGFLSPDSAAPEVALVSPLRDALGAGVVDVSHVGKLELRGSYDTVEPAAGDELLPLSPTRALLVTGSAAAARARLSAGGIHVYDMTAALAAFEVDGEDVLRRLTELDLERLPTVGSIARGTPAIVQRREGGRFRIFVPQELGYYVVEVVLDTLRGLGR